jgi:hypothetical protein
MQGWQPSIFQNEVSSARHDRSANRCSGDGLQTLNSCALANALISGFFQLPNTIPIELLARSAAIIFTSRFCNEPCAMLS